MSVMSFTAGPRYPRGNSSMFPLQVTLNRQDCLDTVETGKSFILVGNRTPVVHPVATDQPQKRSLWNPLSHRIALISVELFFIQLKQEQISQSLKYNKCIGSVETNNSLPLFECCILLRIYLTDSL
jgi:hypothetical protein